MKMNNTLWMQYNWLTLNLVCSWFSVRCIFFHCMGEILIPLKSVRTGFLTPDVYIWQRSCACVKFAQFNHISLKPDFEWKWVSFSCRQDLRCCKGEAVWAAEQGTAEISGSKRRRSWRESFFGNRGDASLLSFSFVDRGSNDFNALRNVNSLFPPLTDFNCLLFHVPPLHCKLALNQRVKENGFCSTEMTRHVLPLYKIRQRMGNIWERKLKNRSVNVLKCLYTTEWEQASRNDGATKWWRFMNQWV